MFFAHGFVTGKKTLIFMLDGLVDFTENAKNKFEEKKVWQSRYSKWIYPDWAFICSGHNGSFGFGRNK